MTFKPARTKFEKEKDPERIRFLRREQEEQEAKRQLRYWVQVAKEEADEEEAIREYRGFDAPTL